MLAAADGLFERLHVVGASKSACSLVVRLLTLTLHPVGLFVGVGKVGSNTSVSFLEERPTFLLAFGARLAARVVAHGIGLSVAYGDAGVANAAAEDAAHALDSGRIVGYEF